MLLESKYVESINETSSEKSDVVIVGAGPVALRFIETLQERRFGGYIVLFGDEPWCPYDRVKLSSLLAGEINHHSVFNSFPFETNHRVDYRQERIVRISAQERYVESESGAKVFFDRLVLATGSIANIPNIPGVNLPGVFSFRDLSDTQQLMARLVRTRTTVVIGGGLLGMEAARAMQRRNTKVHLIDHSPTLMSRQLPDALGLQMQKIMEGYGIKVHTLQSVQQIIGDVSVKSVLLRDGAEILCDTVIVAAGVRPNIDLAREAGINVGRGIKINTHLRSSHDDIYAIGDCAEFNLKVFGLVGPGMEQANVLSALFSEELSEYKGSISATSLKIIGESVYTAGIEATDIDPLTDQIVSYENTDRGLTHTLVLRHRRIIGAYGIGDWPEFLSIKLAIAERAYISPLKLWRFRRTDSLWPEDAGDDVCNWPDAAVVCSCKNISKGKICAAMNARSTSIYDIQRKTGASTVCGSCEPLIKGLLGQKAEVIPQLGYRTLFHLSALSLVLVAAVAFLAPINYAQSINEISLDVLWRNDLFRQISGFSLIGVLTLGVVLLSIRKRANIQSMGKSGLWRLVHVALATVAVAMLVLHTGLRMGSNLNFLLMSSFLIASVSGAVVSFVTAFEHLIRPAKAKVLRKISLWGHLITLWPLPVLLGFHILSAYYF